MNNHDKTAFRLIILLAALIVLVGILAANNAPGGVFLPIMVIGVAAIMIPFFKGLNKPPE